MLPGAIHSRLLAMLLFASSLTALPARAADRILVIVPEGVASEVLEAIQIELQLSGLEVVVHRAPQLAAGRHDSDAAALHADIELALLVAIEGSATRVQVLRGGPTAEITVESAHPRAVALSVGAAADRARRARVEPLPEPEAVASAVRDEESADVELGTPAPISPSDLLAAPSGTQEGADEPDPLPEPQREPEPEPSEPMGRPLRLLLEVGFAVLGAAVLGVPAALLTNAYLDVPDEPWLYGFGAAAPVGVALGVYLGGLLAGGDGAVGWTLLGGVLGGLVAGGLLLVGAAVDRDPMDRVDPGFTIIGGLASAVLPPLGAMLGFELTIGDPAR